MEKHERKIKKAKHGGFRLAWSVFYLRRLCWMESDPGQLCSSAASFRNTEAGRFRKTGSISPSTEHSASPARELAPNPTLPGPKWGDIFEEVAGCLSTRRRTSSQGLRTRSSAKMGKKLSPENEIIFENHKRAQLTRTWNQSFIQSHCSQMSSVERGMEPPALAVSVLAKLLSVSRKAGKRPRALRPIRRNRGNSTTA